MIIRKTFCSLSNFFDNNSGHYCTKFVCEYSLKSILKSLKISGTKTLQKRIVKKKTQEIIVMKIEIIFRSSVDHLEVLRVVHFGAKSSRETVASLVSQLRVYNDNFWMVKWRRPSPGLLAGSFLKLVFLNENGEKTFKLLSEKWRWYKMAIHETWRKRTATKCVPLVGWLLHW